MFVSDTYVTRENLKVKSGLADFIEMEALVGLSIEAGEFWHGFSDLCTKHMCTNRNLLQEREHLQQKIDHWHAENGSATSKPAAYQSFLRKIGYLVAEPENFRISTGSLDPEITAISGPQLVVPLSNARYALNAVNARWGSLYDALYGTDAIPQRGNLQARQEYNSIRGQAVFDYVATFMDEVFPLKNGRHGDVTAYKVEKKSQIQCARLVIIANDAKTQLQSEAAFIGYREENNKLYILLTHHRLHIELVVDHTHPIGKIHPAGLSDVLVESAITVIQDCEDSVAAVDVQDKVAVYRNWLGLMQASLEETFEKNSRKVVRKLNPDKHYRSANGDIISMKGRALMMVRNVGHHMMTDIVLDGNGKPVGEGFMDATITTLCAMHDIKQQKNSKVGAVYIVKPKMHCPKEVAFSVALFADVERILGLSANTIKIGIMDEERRMSATLKASIKEAEERVFFINTGFLDRTGDEIHTAMQAGPVLPKEQLKADSWLSTYEDRNVVIGLQCGFIGRAQIGKGMWAKPDSMHDMLEQKIDHPKLGANCAWVPSPTASTLHALHYHYVNVQEVQEKRLNEALPSLSALFSLPILDPSRLSERMIQDELDNNAQGILGYVVRWVNQGIGCSKVPDIHNTPLMEDRATCRISSQIVANWLKHNVISEADLLESFKRMAAVVDAQNKNDSSYNPMALNTENSAAFQAALTLVLQGAESPSGYTEEVLHTSRKVVKKRLLAKSKHHS
ncbi:MAG: malate synthase [Candidatus Tokpelaia sp. JSC085]|nr:MAG: malate synthase [Candidatus Tokpelaia sp. JSC085]